MMDIFFVIASIGFVLLVVLIIVALLYSIQFVRTLERIAGTVEEEALALKGDLDEARAGIKNGRLGLLSLFGFAGKAGKRILNKKRSS